MMRRHALLAGLVALVSGPMLHRALAQDPAGNQQPQVVLTPQGVGGAAVPTTGAEKERLELPTA